MSTSKKNRHLKAAHQILIALGLPRAQQNERSALCLLALLDLTPGLVLVTAFPTRALMGRCLGKL